MPKMTIEQIQHVCPKFPPALFQPLADAMDGGGITDPRAVAMFLGQCAHESADFTQFLEEDSGAAYEGRRDLGNTQPGDGVRFRGRGIIQVTGRLNYEDYGDELGLDLISNPDLAMDFDVSPRIAAAFWNRHGLTDLALCGDISTVTRRINGGYNGLAQRTDRWQKFASVLGVIQVC